MARLLFTKPTGEASVIDLKEGMNRIGRTSDNDIQIEDNSISKHHCELKVSPQGIGVRDLHSTNGTFLDDQPITEAWLRPGQILRLGKVNLLLEELPDSSTENTPQPESGPIPIPPPMRDSTFAPVPDACPQHPSTPAQFICCICERLSCPACVKTMQVGMRTFYACPACGKTAVKLSEHRKQNLYADRTFWQLLPGVFVYPFRDYGTLILVGGAIFFSLLGWGQNIARYALFYGFVAMLILAVMSVGYFFSFMKGVAQSAANGEDKPPSWPDFIDFNESFLSPAFQCVAIGLLCFGPGLIAEHYYSQPEVGFALLICGAFCAPMALLTVSLADSVTGLNPAVIFPSIFRVPGPYFVACGVFLVTLSLAYGAKQLLLWADFGTLGTPLIHFVNVYGATVQMRLMGTLYYTNKGELGWFETR